MTANPSIDPARFLAEHLERAEPDLLRSMLKTFIDALMGAEADALCGAPYGARSEEQVNSRNGYRAREWDTRAGTIEVEIPRLRQGSYFPDWLLERRRRAERALTPVASSACTGTTRPPSRTFRTSASAATNVYGPASSGRVRNDSTCSSRSLAITLTWDLDNRVMPNVSTSFSIRRVETPSR